MAFVLEDFIKETTATTGTDDLVLEGAVSQFNPFSSALDDGDTTIYGLIASDGSKEAGLGTYVSASNTLQRTTIRSSTDGDAKLDLSSGTHIVFIGPDADGMARAYSALQSSDIGSSVQGYDADTAKLDTAQTWSAPQYLSAGGTLGVTTVASAGTSQSVSLDGKIHILTLDNASPCTITGSQVGSAYSSALVLIKQDATGGRAFSFAAAHKELSTQDVITTAGSYNAWLLWSPDGSTVFVSAAGAES